MSNATGRDTRLNFKFVVFLTKIRVSGMPPLIFKFKELRFELLRRLSQAERTWVVSNEFLQKGGIWTNLRYSVLEENDGLCEACGNEGRKCGGLNVDHKFPRKYYPQLALLWSNLQVLCAMCNKGKGNRYKTDWKKKRPKQTAAPSFKPPKAILAEAKAIAPEWDQNDMLEKYSKYLERKRYEVVHNPNRAFLGWVRKCIKDDR